MVICNECKREVLTDEYQTIQTKRKTTIHICNKCCKEVYGIEVKSARDSKESTQ